MDKEQFKKLKVGDKVVVVGCTCPIHHFQLNKEIVIDSIDVDFITAHDSELSQHVSVYDIKIKK